MVNTVSKAFNIGRLMAAVFLCVCLLSGTGSAAAMREPSLTAEAAIVVEASTGRVVYEKNADRLMYPASLTKMMTCILAIENASMDSTVVISPNAAATEDTWLDESAGRAIRMGDLVDEMMIISDNGAAVAIAEQMASSVPAFAEKMTQKAQAIGATKTRFANPNGLTELNHVTTARDMMKIARYGWNIPEFRRITGQRKKDIYFQSPRELALSVETTNELLGVYPGMAGIKTGWTNAAGGCFAGAATHGNVTLISIVLNAPDTKDRFNDTVKLMDYGFSRVRVVKGPVKEQIQKDFARSCGGGQQVVFVSVIGAQGDLDAFGRRDVEWGEDGDGGVKCGWDGLWNLSVEPKEGVAVGMVGVEDGVAHDLVSIGEDVLGQEVLA